MKRKRILRRLEAALEKSQREDPDGLLSNYSWMWRALLRSSPNRVSLILRFTSLVVVDATLLLGWAIARPIPYLFRDGARRLALATAAAAVTLVVAIGSPPSHPTAPWTGAPELGIEANGLVLFEGQMMRDDEMVHLVEHYGVQEASIMVDLQATVGRLDEIADLLATAGVAVLVVTLERPS